MGKRISAAVPLALVGALWYVFLALPWPIPLRWREPERTAFMEYRRTEAVARGEALEIDYRWTPLDRISRHLHRAVIVAEDGRFYEHQGIDWAAVREEVRYGGDTLFSWTDPADLRAVVDAVRYYRSHRDEVRGRSTITQQLAKNLYFSPERALERKAAEFVVAHRLERFLSKDRILELYLNTAEWGPGIFGAEAAARHYFGRSAAALTVDQAAALAATLPHPLTSNPTLRPGRMAWRKRLILARMGGAPGPPVPLDPPPAPELPGIEVPLLAPATTRDTTSADAATTRTAVPRDTSSADPGRAAPPRDTLPAGLNDRR